jgi:hypothetical protein
MEDGSEISSNNASDSTWGGGVNVSKNSTFMMSGAAGGWE